MTVIAIDGPSGAGKGTLARRIAGHYGYAYLDTGLLYRAVGQRALAAGVDPAEGPAVARLAGALGPADLAAPELRSEAAAAAASRAAASPDVRAALFDLQRAFALSPPENAAGAVLDGRDIGTVVCPDADAKLFLTASIEARAERRVKELRERGLAAIESEVVREMRERDARDSQRAIAPLEPAIDALVIDTSNLDPDAVFTAALAHIEAVTNGATRRGSRSNSDRRG